MNAMAEDVTHTTGSLADTCVEIKNTVLSPPGYELIDEIGHGGMGVVYRARDVALDRDVAVKLLAQRYPPDSSAAQRFLVEARITGQLQHPGIPPVHQVGVLADGRPFLAMKLIKGNTLETILKQRPDPEAERGRFLSIFEAVCQAVGYAHAHRVLHRDLKPANVMVGAFGEVQVMDWGLAKVLSDKAPATADALAAEQTQAWTEVSPAPEAGSPTVAGSLVGTPAFIPPEQALGEIDKVNERSDVFGLGALLTMLLTGKPPYVGETAESVRVQAVRGKLENCFARLDASGAEPELLELCKKCLAFEPADRPPNAGAVAAAVAGLRADADERARRAELERVKAEGDVRAAAQRAVEQRQRRRLVLAASGIVALVLVAGLSVSMWQMRRAMQAEAAATASARDARDERDAKEVALKSEQQARADETKARQQAFSALRSMTAEVVERKFAQGATLTDEDRAFLRGIIEQFDAFAAIKADNADSRAMRAEGRYRVGNIRYSLGELQEAERDYDQALGIQQQLVADFPGRPEYRQDLAKSHNNRGLLLYTLKRMVQAEQDYNQALNIQTQLVADFPTRSEFRQDLAKSYNNRGNVLSDMNRVKEARQDYDQALRIREQLVADFPSRTDIRGELATSHNNRAILLRATRQLPAAEKDYDETLRIFQQLAADFPTRPEFRRGVAGSHNNRGNLLRALNRLPAAEKDYNEAVRIRKLLAAEFPSRPEFRQDLATSLKNRGALMQNLGRLAEAKKDGDEARTINQQLVTDFPNQPDLHNELAGDCVNLAHLHRLQGDWSAAKRLLQEGRPHHLAALKVNPQNPIYRDSYGKLLFQLTQVHAGVLEQADAVQAAETRRVMGWDPAGDSYDAACSLSLCILIVAKHDKLNDKQRQEAVQFYGDAAMKLLRESVGLGFREAAHMKQDNDLDPLRGRDDFRKLQMELEALEKGKPAKKDGELN
jgi:tetratricopeptide (TPR) repeat protein